MSEIVAGHLEVGCNENDEVVINHPDLLPDENGVGHIVFSPEQARNLASLLLKHACTAEQQSYVKRESANRKAAEGIPVDRNARCLADGRPETTDHRKINPVTGQQMDYVVLTPEERAKGFVRPVRDTYIHVGIDPVMHGIVLVKRGVGGCGTRTVMARQIAETYARDPGFYSGTFCVNCRRHLPLNEFVWEGTAEMVGS